MDGLIEQVSKTTDGAVGLASALNNIVATAASETAALRERNVTLTAQVEQFRRNNGAEKGRAVRALKVLSNIKRLIDELMLEAEKACGDEKLVIVAKQTLCLVTIKEIVNCFSQYEPSIIQYAAEAATYAAEIEAARAARTGATSPTTT